MGVNEAFEDAGVVAAVFGSRELDEEEGVEEPEALVERGVRRSKAGFFRVGR